VTITVTALDTAGSCRIRLYVCKASAHSNVQICTDKCSVAWWWNRQVVSNQYGLGGRTARNWGLDSLEGDLLEEELVANRQDQIIDTAKYKFRDEEYYSSKDFKLEDIEVPLLSVANWVCDALCFECKISLMPY